MKYRTLGVLGIVLSCTGQSLQGSAAKPTPTNSEEAIECVPFTSLEETATPIKPAPSQVALGTEKMTVKDAAAIARQCKDEQVRAKLPEEQKEAAYKLLRAKEHKHWQQKETRKAINYRQLAGYIHGENYVKDRTCCIC
jgi:hypothetical protein